MATAMPSIDAVIRAEESSSKSSVAPVIDAIEIATPNRAVMIGKVAATTEANATTMVTSATANPQQFAGSLLWRLAVEQRAGCLHGQAGRAGLVDRRFEGAERLGVDVDEFLVVHHVEIGDSAVRVDLSSRRRCGERVDDGLRPGHAVEPAQRMDQRIDAEDVLGFVERGSGGGASTTTCAWAIIAMSRFSGGNFSVIKALARSDPVPGRVTSETNGLALAAANPAPRRSSIQMLKAASRWR